MGGDDLVPLLGRGRGPDVGLRQGVLTAWDSGTGANTVTVAGGELVDLPRLDTGATLTEGDVVILLRLRSSWCILGRVTAPTT